MFSNPITSFIGVVIALCPIVGAFFPEIKAICDSLMGEAIGLGFITAKDGVKFPLSSGTMKTIGGAFMILSFIAGCSTIMSGKTTLERMISQGAAGTYTVTVQKDGKILVTETYECTSDGQKLTGCHQR